MAHRPGIVPGKVRPPTLRTDTVDRIRLRTMLERTPARVVLVSAPAGFGKTVLVQQWLAESGVPGAWLSVDTLDDDPDRFFAHLAAAFRNAEMDGFREAAEVLAGRVAPAREDPATHLVQALAGAPDGSTLVLDDVHLLSAPAVWAFLGRLVADGPPGLRIVLLTREDPPLRLARLRVSGELAEIRARELRFRADECSRFFDAVGPDGLSGDRVAQLVEKTEGWAAGLRLASAALQTADDVDAAAASFGGRHELLVDYLLEEALRGRTAELQRFLMETAILPRFTAEACRAVTGDSRAATHLEEVDEANLFLISLDAQRRWYRYHHLFAELLVYRLERLFPERLPLLRERASRWYEAQGQLSEALEQAAHLADPTPLVRLLDRHGYEMLARSEFASFAHWLARVPEPERWPWPLFLVAVTWYHVQVDRRADIHRWLELLDAALADPPEEYPAGRLDEARLHRDVIRAFWLRIHGRMEESLEAARTVLAQVPEHDVVLRGMTEFHIAAVRMRMGDMPSARDELERARETTRRGRAEYIFLASLGHLVAVHTQVEGVAVARRHLGEAMAQARARHLESLPAYGIVLYQGADACLLADDRDEARRLLDRADEVTRGERDTDIRANVLIRRARLEALEGRDEVAGALLDEAAVISRGQSLQPFGTSIELERARLAELARGRLVGPETHLADEDVVDEGWTILREAQTVLHMRHALKAGRHDEARERALTLEVESRPRGRRTALCLALLTRASLSSEASERHELLAAGLTLAEQGGWVQPVVELGAPLRPLLEAAAGGGLPDPVRRFVREDLLTRIPASTEPGVDLVAELGLTDRELDLLGHLTRGLTNRELARTLFVSENTVKTHLKHIYQKLDVSTRTAAVGRARTLGILATSGD